MTSAAPHLVEVALGPGVRAAFTTAPDNLSLVVGDDPERSRRNRAVLEGWVGAPVAFARQVHGREVHLCDEPPEPQVDVVATADALVAVGPTPAVAVLVADCVPILMADETAGVVAAVHAGRRGLVDGVLAAVVDRMVSVGAHAAALRAVVGPSVCGRCYEVPADMQAQVEHAVPGTASTTSWGTPAVDLRAGVHVQLTRLGVAQVDDLDACTRTDARWYSHRAAGASRARPQGRFAGLVRLLPRS